MLKTQTVTKAAKPCLQMANNPVTELLSAQVFFMYNYEAVRDFRKQHEVSECSPWESHWVCLRFYREPFSKEKNPQSQAQEDSAMQV